MKKLLILSLLFGAFSLQASSFRERRKKLGLALPTLITPTTAQKEEAKKDAIRLEEKIQQLENLVSQHTIPTSHPAHDARATVSGKSATDHITINENGRITHSTVEAYINGLIQDCWNFITDARRKTVKFPENPVTGSASPSPIYLEADPSDMYGQSGRNEFPVYSSEEKALFEEMEQEEMATFSQPWR